ncbi:MAG: 3-deoxy-7-phosphoheptulonate synthase [Christensenellaceae bacterium]|nr:3-deoxy-7-phosphoheptulonate synthase [Christensenellaceae bacterium]
MIIVLRKGTEQREIDRLTNLIIERGVAVNPIVGSDLTILGLIGDTSKIDEGQIESHRCVERIMHVAEPFKKANRMFHPGASVVNVGGVDVGGKELVVMAGPCSVESREQIIGVAQSVQASGASVLRGGAFKPRTSPYAFQGLKYEGLDLLCAAKEATGLPIVSEIMSPYDLDLFVEKVDCIQVGARNMQNFDLLRQLGKVDKPILLKRGLSATIEEWLMSAEYIMAGGNERVILCERGIRTFETYTRNTIDLGAIPAVKKLSHLPVIVDPSHATGKWWMVEPLARAAVAVGADGLMIEVHNDPAHALCDGAQSVKPDLFDDIMRDIRQIAAAVGREVRQPAAV